MYAIRLHNLRLHTRVRQNWRLAAVLCYLLSVTANVSRAIEPFGPPVAQGNNCNEPLARPRQYAELIPLPPVCDTPPRLLDQRRCSVLPQCTTSHEESSLLFEVPKITRPLVTPLLIGPAPPSPPATHRPVSPGFLRDLGRSSLTAPVPPGVVSAHAPPWEQLPTPKELDGKILKAIPHQYDSRGCEMPFTSGDFAPEPYYYDYDACAELGIYGNKYLNDVQRPAIEWGLPFYLNGPIPRSGTGLGVTNLVQPWLYVYGDFRSAIAYNDNVANEQTVWANRLNLDIDLGITATERIHMFWGPMDDRNQFHGYFYDDGEIQANDAWDAWDERTDTLYFEGDLGAILGGFGGFYPNVDLPFAVGLMPLVFQNGVWIEDAFFGIAATIPARHNPFLDISNYDTTIFVGLDEVTSDRAFQNDNEAANIIGLHTFIERRRGYLEIGYAFLDDTENQGRSYHNLGVSYSRRYLNLVSNAVRMIVNTGQGGPDDDRTADGVLLLMENNFLTRNPYHVIPYANFFAGFGTPQSAARIQGPLKNTGINFESDLLTGYPILDDSANDTYGGAIGVDLIGGAYEQQFILEAAFLQTMNNDSSRVALGDQYALGVRYQRPLSHTLLIRADAMHGWLENSEDISGVRMELRRKF